MERNKRILLSGMISKDPHYRTKFATSTAILQQLGFYVMNPAVLPKRGFTHRQYMHVTLAMLDVCEIVCLLPDWYKSTGAIMEFVRAILKRKIIVAYDELVRDPECIGGDNFGLLQQMRLLRRAS